MIVSKHLFLTLFFFFCLCINSQSQNKKEKYTDYDHGLWLQHNKKWDSAFLMFNQYVNSTEDSLQKSTAYRYMGEMQWAVGDLYGAEQNYTEAIDALNPLNEKHKEELGIIYSLLGNVRSDLKLYNEAIDFYNTAIVFSKGSDYVFEIMNGKAIALQKKHDYINAISIYDSLLTMQLKEQDLIARVIDNRAMSKWLQNPSQVVVQELHQALRIRENIEDDFGLNASYAHLADYYSQNNGDSALWYAKKMREKAQYNQSPIDILESIDKLIRLVDSPILKEKLYSEYKNLNDSLQLSKDSSRNRFAYIKYDAEKSKASNLVLEQGIIRHKLTNFGIAALALLIICILYVWFIKRRKRIKDEAENAIKNANLKTSQKVHDVVANGLYGIMNELEHNPTIEKEPLITKIEDLYEKSRNISYEQEESGPVNTEGYDRQIHNLLTAFDNAQTRIILVGNQPKFWSNIKPDHKQQLQLVLKELMVNMKKHSQAKNVVIKFSQDNSAALINYKDDGVGIASDVKYGNGLQNTVSRINSIGGEVIFEKSDKPGVSIAISFPL